MTVSARNMRDADANETSGELGSALGGTLMGVSQLRIPWSDQSRPFFFLWYRSILNTKTDGAR